MSRAIFILPFINGDVAYPGLTDAQKAQITGYCAASYVPPQPGWAQYVLAFINTTDAVILALSSQPNALFVCGIDAEGAYTPAPLTPTQRNGIRSKIESMGFTGAQYGLVNAAIQSSQHRAELAYKLSVRAFYRHPAGAYMTEDDVRGTFIA